MKLKAADFQFVQDDGSSEITLSAAGHEAALRAVRMPGASRAQHRSDLHLDTHAMLELTSYVSRIGRKPRETTKEKEKDKDSALFDDDFDPAEMLMAMQRSSADH